MGVGKGYSRRHYRPNRRWHNLWEASGGHSWNGLAENISRCRICWLDSDHIWGLVINFFFFFFKLVLILSIQVVLVLGLIFSSKISCRVWLELPQEFYFPLAFLISYSTLGSDMVRDWWLALFTWLVSWQADITTLQALWRYLSLELRCQLLLWVPAPLCEKNPLTSALMPFCRNYLCCYRVGF